RCKGPAVSSPATSRNSDSAAQASPVPPHRLDQSASPPGSFSRSRVVHCERVHKRIETVKWTAAGCRSERCDFSLSPNRSPSAPDLRDVDFLARRVRSQYRRRNDGRKRERARGRRNGSFYKLTAREPDRLLIAFCNVTFHKQFEPCLSDAPLVTM